MVLNQVSPKPIDNSTVWTASTPPESVAVDLLEDPSPAYTSKPSPSSVPWPGSTFIISSVPSGQAITLLDGKIMLAPLGGRGSILWECVENGGWLAFRNVASGRFLGHNGKGRLCCSAERHDRWEHFCVRMRPEGGYVLLSTNWGELWPVGIKVEQGVEVLVKIKNGSSEGGIWEFIKA